FISIDILTAVILSLSSCCQLLDQVDWESDRISKLSKKKDLEELSINPHAIYQTSLKVGCLYLLNPYSIAACVGRSTSIIHNFLLSILLLSSNTNLRVVSCAIAAVVSYQSVHSSVLLLPILMILEEQRQFRKREQSPAKGDDGKSSTVDYTSKSVI